MTDRVLVIAGPTAVGKSALAHAVARAVGGDVLSADSRQVYRGMDVGTAKPSREDREEVRYEGLDVLSPGVRASSGWFRECAETAITESKQTGRPVVVAGGSTLYVDALVSGIADLPTVPAPVAAEVGRLAASPGGLDALFDELLAADPDAAATLDRTKRSRLVRLVGVLRQSGRRPSELWAERARPPVPHRLVVLTAPRAELYRRIDARVLRMMEAGLLAETERLAGQPGALPTLRATIGYAELLPVLAAERSLDEAVRLIQRNSRRYAKRQLTWLRRYDEAVRLDGLTATAADVLAAVRPWPDAG